MSAVPILPNTTPVAGSADSMICLITDVFGTSVMSGVSSAAAACPPPPSMVAVFAQTIQTVMSTYVTLCFVLIGFLMTHWMYMAIMQGALTGNHGGVQHHWSLLRSSIAIAAIAPAALGFCTVQAVALYLIIQGSGLADNVWKQAVNVLSGSQIQTMAGPTLQAVQRFETDLLKMRVCAQYFKLQDQLVQQQQSNSSLSNTPGLGIIVPSFGPPYAASSGTGAATATMASASGNDTVLHYNLVDPSSNKIIVPDACGALQIDTWQTKNGSNSAAFPAVSAAAKQVLLAQQQAVDTMTTALDPIAAAIINLTVNPYLTQVGAAWMLTPSSIADNITSSQQVVTQFYQQYTGALYNIGLAYEQSVNAAAAGQNVSPTMSDITNAATSTGWTSAGLYWRNIASAVHELKSAGTSVPYLFAQVGNNELGPEVLKDLSGAFNLTESYSATSGYHTAQQTQATTAAAPNSTAQSGVQPVQFLTFSPRTWIPSIVTGFIIKDTDPISLSIDIGSYLKTAGVIFAGAYAAEKASGFFGGLEGKALEEALKKVMPPHVMLSAAKICLIVGITLSAIVPMIPVAFWIAFVFFYLVLVVEFVLAAPIWAVGLAVPEGQGIAGTYGLQGLRLVLSLFFRPVLGIFGLLAAMLTIYLSNIVVWGAYAKIATMPGVDFLDSIGLVLCFATIWLILSWKSCELITTIPDKTMAMIGATSLSQGEGSVGQSLMSDVRSTISSNSRAITSLARSVGSGGGGEPGDKPGKPNPDASLDKVKDEIDMRASNTGFGGENQASIEPPQSGPGTGPGTGVS